MNPMIEMDGSHVSTTVVGSMPTSRGTVTLADSSSSDPESTLLIDLNYLSTEANRCMMREGLRKLREVLCDTPARLGRRWLRECEAVEDWGGRGCFLWTRAVKRGD